MNIIMCAKAQDNEIDAILYKAYISSSEVHWKEGVKRLQKIYEEKGDKESAFALAMGKYGLLNGTMATKNEELFDAHADETLELLESLVEQDKTWAEPYAVMSSILGLKMGYSPMKGMYLGPKSNSYIDKAFKINQHSALVWKVQGSSKLYTPAMFGGDVEEAVKAFEKSIALYEKNPDQLTNNWLYIDALAFLGQAYSKAGDVEKALQTYEKALRIEPEFNWVKYGLLPAIANNSK
jgi:tetratricopeptide (TPR) repeat protein